MIEFKIDGKKVVAQEGETILNVARREGIYIPTLCYLTKVSPIASCRMCVVEVDGVDGFVLSCQTPPTQGANITTNSSSLFKERQNIMKLYDVNHPLQCGVCDKSGECDLQNKTLEFKVTQQSFSAKDLPREIKDWNFIQYDPSLCIMCERCVSTCNEAIGDDAIEVFFGGYNSHITTKNSDTLECTFCGECIAVCPVGAMTSKDFKYKANAWELSKTPTSCMHCSLACAIYYDAKISKRNQDKDEIFRVKNDFEFNSLCGAGRFGFDFENKNVTKNKEAFTKAVQAFKEAKAIKFTSEITNEEALILQKIKEKYNLKLINNEAYSFKEFLNNFLSVSEEFYNANLKDVHDSNFVISVGSLLTSDNPLVRFNFNHSLKINKGAGLYFHPVEDKVLNSFSKNLLPLTHKVGAEEAVLYLLLDLFANKDNLPQETLNYLNSFKSKEVITVKESVKEKQKKIVKEKQKDEEGNEVEVEVEKEVLVPVIKEVQKEVEKTSFLKLAGLMRVCKKN